MKVLYLPRYVKCEAEKKTAINTMTSLREALLAKEHILAKLEADLKIEKEWRQQLQKTSELDKETLYKKQEDLNYWQKVGQVSILDTSRGRVD